MAELSQATKDLIQKYKAWYQSQEKPSQPTIQVDEVASAVAAFYEKIRGVVEWREEHLMRRAAIERVLKRRLLLEKESKEIASPLVLELIRGGHFPNNRIPETKISEVERIIVKYIFILEKSPEPTKEKQKVQLYDWLLSVAACEIEETLSPPLKERALVEYMTDSMIEKIRLEEGVVMIGGMTEEEKNTQIYIAVQRALLKLDSPIITYSLFKKRYALWQKLSPDNPQLQEVSQNIYFIWESLEKDLDHSLSDRFYRIAERYDTPYLIMGDIIAEDPLAIEKKITGPEELESSITAVYQKRLGTLKARIGRAAIFATLSIFVTKMLLAFAIEVPFDIYVTQEFSKSTLGLNILIPPLLMLFLILTIRPPKKENLQQVIMETIKIAYLRERKESYSVTLPKKRGWLMNVFISIFYLFSFIVTFGAITWGLRELNFGILSIIIFLIFTSLIAFAGTKLRERSRELEVIEKKESGLGAVIDLFSLPMIQVGKWLSAQWVRYNIISILINFLIDLPFQSFVEFLEQWRAFLKEKKEEIH